MYNSEQTGAKIFDLGQLKHVKGMANFLLKTPRRVTMSI